MKIYIITILILTLNFGFLMAQTSAENILQEIETNNLHLKSLSEKNKAKVYEAKASLQLENPHLGGEYIINQQENAKKYGFELTQAFDFPTVYGKRKDLANEQIKSFDLQFTQTRREILFQAKNLIYEIIYLNKLSNSLSSKTENLKKAHEKYQALFEQKSATILDVSKARMQYFSAQSELERVKLELNNVHISLNELNGGNAVLLMETSYPTITKNISLKEFKSNYMSNASNLQLAQQSVVLSQKEIKLSKSERLPNFELGYKYANEEMLQFSGVVFGVSIPLWAGRKEVKSAQANFIASETELQHQKSNAEKEMDILYRNYTISQKLYNEYNTVIKSLNILESLNKQFELKNITSYEYYSQLSDYYQLEIEFLEAEITYYLSALVLEKHKL